MDNTARFAVTSRGGSSRAGGPIPCRGKEGGVLGIEDGWVVLAYALCVLSSALCVVYGIVNWNKGDEPVTQEGVEWAKEEQEEEEAL